MSCLCPHCNSFPLKDHIWWVSGRKGRNNWWCAICGEKYDWKQSNTLLVVQTGESVNQDRKHTSGGVFVAVDSNMGAVVGAEEGVIESIPGNEGIIAQAWVNVRGGLRIFSVYFWHSEGWTPRNEALLEAVLKRARTTRHRG